MDEPAQPAVELPQDKQALLRHLEKTNPEALALAHDWDDVAYNVIKSKAKLERYVCERFMRIQPSYSAPQAAVRKP